MNKLTKAQKANNNKLAGRFETLLRMIQADPSIIPPECKPYETFKEVVPNMMGMMLSEWKHEHNREPSELSKNGEERVLACYCRRTLEANRYRNILEAELEVTRANLTRLTIADPKVIPPEARTMDEDIVSNMLTIHLSHWIKTHHGAPSELSTVREERTLATHLRVMCAATRIKMEEAI